MNDAATTLKEHPEWKIRVEGFTDNQGSKDANLKLSSNRAEAVRIGLRITEYTAAG